MNGLETVRVAVRALLRNKTRSFLTTLGVIIGVAAVIAMVAIGEGAKSQVEATFNAMGTNLLILRSGSSHSHGARGGFGSQPTLTWDDLTAIRQQITLVRDVAPTLNSHGQVVSEDTNWNTSIQGTTPDYFDARSWPIAEGTAFTDADVKSDAKVVVLGQTVVNELFGQGAEAVGETVRIDNVPFQVIGVAATKGQSPMGQDYDDEVFIPVTTFQTKIQGGLGKYVAGSVMLSSTSPDTTSAAEQQVELLLRERHHLKGKAPDDFSIRNLSEIASARESGTQTLSALLASIAAVSLLVGGIGIMNIMLVSVTERTREIGVRMAIGARPRDVLAQFLFEALSLSVLGGLLGIGFGMLAAHVLAGHFGWPFVLSPEVMAIAIGFSGLVGVVFGLYPARKASMLDPIDALRFE